MTITPETIDLGRRRAERAKARAAKREGRGETLDIRDGDLMIATLGAEFPLDIVEPLVDVNLDIALVVEQAIQVASADSQAQQMASLDLIAQILAANPNLFRELIDAVKEMGRRLFGAEGYAALVATRPTPWDVVDMIKDLMSWYGVSLGESSPLSTSSSDGETSRPISNLITASTHVDAGTPPEPPVSSVSDGSPT